MMGMGGAGGGGGSILLVVQAQSNDRDYTCNPRDDYSAGNKCPTLEDGKCDDLRITSLGNEFCINQDCIDCNSECQKFDFDCYGCLDAKGCYYCEGDATCQNS